LILRIEIPHTSSFDSARRVYHVLNLANPTNRVIQSGSNILPPFLFVLPIYPTSLWCPFLTLNLLELFASCAYKKPSFFTVFTFQNPLGDIRNSSKKYNCMQLPTAYLYQLCRGVTCVRQWGRFNCFWISSKCSRIGGRFQFEYVLHSGVWLMVICASRRVEESSIY
jgi:hypothetical protein